MGAGQFRPVSFFTRVYIYCLSHYFNRLNPFNKALIGIVLENLFSKKSFSTSTSQHTKIGTFIYMYIWKYFQLNNFCGFEEHILRLTVGSSKRVQYSVNKRNEIIKFTQKVVEWLYRSFAKQSI